MLLFLIAALFKWSRKTSTKLSWIENLLFEGNKKKVGKKLSPIMAKLSGNKHLRFESERGIKK